MDSSKALSIAMNFIKNRDITDEDLKQDLYLSALEKAKTTNAKAEYQAITASLLKTYNDFLKFKIDHIPLTDSDEIRIELEDNENEFEDNVFNEELGYILRDFLLSLRDVEFRIICLRFGFYNNRIYTLREIAQMLCSSPERVRQREMKALMKLRHKFTTNGFRDFIYPEYDISKGYNKYSNFQVYSSRGKRYSKIDLASLDNAYRKGYSYMESRYRKLLSEDKNSDIPETDNIENNNTISSINDKEFPVIHTGFEDIHIKEPIDIGDKLITFNLLLFQLNLGIAQDKIQYVYKNIRDEILLTLYKTCRFNDNIRIELDGNYIISYNSYLNRFCKTCCFTIVLDLNSAEAFYHTIAIGLLNRCNMIFIKSQYVIDLVKMVLMAENNSISIPKGIKLLNKKE